MDRGLISSLAFWAEMGVDAAYADSPVDRLKPVERPTPAAARARAPSLPAREVRSAPDSPDVAAAVAAAQALAAGAASLEDLAAAIAAFEGCPLKRMGASQAVFARGNPAAPVMVIGEGPGAEEDRQGEPFVGRAGQLLDRMLEAAGLTGRVFITNTVFWRPPGNRTPTPQEQAVCRPFVERAIALVRPRLLLLAGGASAKAMLQRDDGVMRLRGQWFDWTSTDGALTRPAIATLHPAFLLRQPAGKALAWRDLLTLSARLTAEGLEDTGA